MSATGEAPATAEVSPDLYAEEFVKFFAEGWRAPKPDGFLAHFKPRFVPEVRMIQPLAPTTTGVAAFERLFRGLFDLFPRRIVLSREGMVEEREALFDPTEMLPAILRAPRSWPRLLRLLRRAG